MSSHHKLSLKDAIFMNLTIMIGAGIITNTVFLTQNSGIFACLSYLFVGVIMLPLISSIAQLIQIHPSGGFYAYAKTISPLLAFTSCWSYFFGKLASASLILFVSATFIKQLFPVLLQNIHTISLSLILLTLFIYLNLFNLKAGSKLQQLFFIAKSIPILFVIISGIMILSTISVATPSIDFLSIASSLPFILYSFTGFEAACAMSRNIENPTKNAPKAIFYSFFIVIGVYAIFQLLVAIMLMPNINNLVDYKDAFPQITRLLNISPAWKQHLTQLINFVVGFSTLGGAYGIIFSNSWNLLILAEHNHTFKPALFTKLNKHNIPAVAVITQGFICMFFILITQGAQAPLQQTAALGTIIAYTVSVIAFLLQTTGPKTVPLLALTTCSGLIIAYILSTIKYGIVSLALFALMSLLGLGMYFIAKKQQQKN